MPTRVLVPSGVLGLGFDRNALARGVAMKPDIIAIDGGSTDSGPFSLGAGQSKYSRAATKRGMARPDAGAGRGGRAAGDRHGGHLRGGCDGGLDVRHHRRDRRRTGAIAAHRPALFGTARRAGDRGAERRPHPAADARARDQRSGPCRDDQYRGAGRGRTGAGRAGNRGRCRDLRPHHRYRHHRRPAACARRPRRRRPGTAPRSPNAARCVPPIR